MSKIVTPESLKKDNFEDRKKQFLRGIERLGEENQLYMHPVLQAEIIKGLDKKETMVYVPKFNIIDRKESPSEAPVAAKEPVAAPKAG